MSSRGLGGVDSAGPLCGDGLTHLRLQALGFPQVVLRGLIAAVAKQDAHGLGVSSGGLQGGDGRGVADAVGAGGGAGLAAPAAHDEVHPGAGEARSAEVAVAVDGHEERRAGSGEGEVDGGAQVQSSLQVLDRAASQGQLDPLTMALPEHPEDLPGQVHVLEIEAGELLPAQGEVGQQA